MRSPVFRGRLTLLVALFLAPTAEPATTPEKGTAEEAPYYEQLAPGLLAGRATTIPFGGGKFRLDVRNLILGRTRVSLTLPAEVMMELRGGLVTTSINAETVDRSEGDFWIVAKGSALLIENKGPVAVIRAVYVYAGSGG